MILNNVLLFHKKSAYKIYFLERQSTFYNTHNAVVRKKVQRFKTAHENHYSTLEMIEKILCRYGIVYDKCYRGGNIDYGKYDLVIAVGGDGTFLEAARGIEQSPIMGVNSDPQFSMGKLCVATASTFEKALNKVLEENFKVNLMHRLRLTFDDRDDIVDIVNDVLVCHKNPAAMSRYSLKVGRIKEDHRSSGIWIAAPAGSSGAIYSAGGKIIARDEKKIQYMARELYSGNCEQYHLKTGILTSRQSLGITSLMRQGMVYVDGDHINFSFPLGSSMKVSISPNPVRTIVL